MSNPDFDKIWGVNSSLDPYNISDTNYKKGWEFVGSMPPARVMFDYIHRFADQKMKNLNERTEALEVVNGVLIPKRKTVYSVGATGIFPGIPAGYYLECTTGGTTGDNTPVITSVTAGDTINDGSVVWTVRQCFSTLGGTIIGNKIFHGNNTTSLVICGGLYIGDGSHIALYGKNTGDVSNAGIVEIVATDGTSNSDYKLMPSGEFLYRPLGTGQNNFYDLGGSAIVAKSLTTNGYIRRASGELMQWGTADLTAGTAKTIDYPLPFATGNYHTYITAVLNGSTYPAVKINNEAGRYQFGVEASEVCRINWFAIGK